MSPQLIPQEDRSQQDRLHPLVYKAIIALVVWLVLSIWILFGRDGYTDLAFAMITFFFVILTGIPLVIWHEWRRYAGQAERRSELFRDWASRQISTRTERISGKDAAIQILVPLAAVTFGMTLVGLIFDFVAIYTG